MIRSWTPLTREREREKEEIIVTDNKNVNPDVKTVFHSSTHRLTLITLFFPGSVFTADLFFSPLSRTLCWCVTTWSCRSDKRNIAALGLVSVARLSAGVSSVQ